MTTWTATLLNTETDEVEMRLVVEAETLEEAEALVEQEASYQGYFPGFTTKA